jgi:hypothetical protein
MSVLLPSTIEYTPIPWIGRKIPSVNISEIEYIVNYDNKAQTAVAYIKKAKVSLVLWNKNTIPTYFEAGDFTDYDTDNRIKELLNFSEGVDAIKKSLLDLYPSNRNKK